MYLKKIELHGFKSFADKVNIEFQPGITGIVGPNGCGKSNISDAVRWVLGEQSVKSLRGSNMADVIFAGSQDRRAQNLAEVTLIFDNSDRMLNYDYNEVEITRRLYRQGNEAEYLLNRQQCRLKDITDLLLDTGLGRDSLSIISQGNISNFADSRPEERRAIFEEAAGVLKYKTRKKETQTKLNQTQDNLDRLDDIIYELETQVKPLERQAQVAKEFLGLEDERKQLHLNILVEDIQADKERLAELNQSLTAITADLAAYYEQRQQFERQNQNLKEKRHQLSEEISRRQEGLLDITRAISDLERQMDLIALESSQKEEKKQAASSQLADLKENQARLTEELTQKSSDSHN